MKSMTKARLRKRMDESVYEPSAKLFKIKALNGNRFDRLLKVVIPGVPIQDSRPRFLKQQRENAPSAYNPNKAVLTKIFEPIYKDSVMEELYIMGPIRVNIFAYVPVPKGYEKSIKKDKNEYKRLEDGKMEALNKPDNDNYEKVHFDVLQDNKFMVISMDENICQNYTQKLYVKEEKYARVELEIYFMSEVPKWYWDTRIETSAEYFKYSISPKYMKSNKIKNWSSTFYDNITRYLMLKKSHYTTAKEVLKILRLYTAEEIYKIEEAGNVDDATSKIMKKVERMIEEWTITNSKKKRKS